MILRYHYNNCQSISCDIFCTVIDNFGDIGVCLRLARQLVHEYNWRVRLFVDDLKTLVFLLPDTCTDTIQQTIDGILIKNWDIKVSNLFGVADVVIEAFACELPTIYLDMMSKRKIEPIWINLEYLSAEDWVVDFHLRQSPHPSYPLVKTFFFPGLSPGSGGLIKERDLDIRRKKFEENSDSRSAWFRKSIVGSLFLPTDSTIISLFIYENPAINSLLAQWRDELEPIVLLIPEACMSSTIARFFGIDKFDARSHVRVGNLFAYGFAFVPQVEYDMILWTSDLNFVRGEDSFVRAQWANRPFVWNIYPQDCDAHIPKLSAALTYVSSGLVDKPLIAFERFWYALNGVGLPNWRDFWQHREAFKENAAFCSNNLESIGNLTGNLVEYVKSQLKLKITQ